MPSDKQQVLDDFKFKAHIVANNLKVLKDTVQTFAPGFPEMSDEKLEVLAKTVNKLIEAKTSAERFRAMEALEDAADHVWQIRIAMMMAVSYILDDTKSIDDLNGMQEALDELEKGSNENE